MPLTPREQLARLCAACGMCCDGTLFSRVAVSDEEARRLRGRLPILAGGEDSGVGFAQPCPAHCASGCAAYEERPATCASYACIPLLRLRAGEIALDQALRTVVGVRHAVDALLPALPQGAGFRDRAGRLRAIAGPAAADVTRAAGATWATLAALERRMARELDARLGARTSPSIRARDLARLGPGPI